MKTVTCRCGQRDIGNQCDCTGSDVTIWTRWEDGVTTSRTLSVESTTEREDHLNGEPLPGFPLSEPRW